MEEKQNDNTIYEAVVISSAIFIIIAIIYNLFLKETFQIPECIIYNKFGIYCPACGCTRAITSLYNLDIISSIKYNPAVIYSVIIIGIYIITHTLQIIFRNKKIPVLRYNVIYIYIGIGILILTCIVKNIIKFID